MAETGLVDLQPSAITFFRLGKNPVADFRI
jgi:hypothetical protein